jgi:hypothetical protein
VTPDVDEPGVRGARPSDDLVRWDSGRLLPGAFGLSEPDAAEYQQHDQHDDQHPGPGRHQVCTTGAVMPDCPLLTV